MEHCEQTYKSEKLSHALSKTGDKPVYVLAAYNYYRLKRVVEYDDFIVIESFEEEGAWMHSSSIRKSVEPKQMIEIDVPNFNPDDGPEIA